MESSSSPCPVVEEESAPPDSVLASQIKLERVLGLTVSGNSSLDCDPLTSVVAYPAGCVVVLYNVRKNKQSHVVSSSRKTITSLAFSPDGKYLATGECGHQPHVRIWDSQEKTQVSEFCGHKFGINCVAFSPNLKYVVSIGSQHDMIVNVWDWKNNLKVASNKVSCKVKAVSFSSEGNYFVTVGNRHVKFWYLDYSRATKYKLEPVPLMGRSAILGDLRNNYFCDVACGLGEMSESTYAITKSGLLCEFNSRRLLDKWVELRTTSANSLRVGKEFIFIGCAEGLVRCFSPFDLRFIATLPRPHFLGVDIAMGLHGSPAITPPQGAKYPDTVAVAYDGNCKKVTCVYNDHSMYVWDIKDIKKVGKSHSFLYHSACIWGVETYQSPAEDEGESLMPAGTFLTCSSDDTIRIWNLEQNIRPDTYYHRNIYSSELLKILYLDKDLSYICDCDVNASGSNDKVDTTYDGKNGVRCLKISQEGKNLAAGDRSGNIRVYEIGQLKEECRIEAHDSEVLCLEYSKPMNSKHFLASASRDRLIHVFDASNGYSFQTTLDDHSSSITAVRFVQQTGNKLQMISCGADKSIIFRKAQFSPKFGFVREHHVGGKATLYDMEVDQNNSILTACQDRNIRVYNTQNAKNTRCFRGSQGEDGTLIKVVLDNTGTLVATSCTDKTLYVYDYTSGECLALMYGHSELVTGLKFTQDGKHLISVSGDGCIFVWKLPPEYLTHLDGKGASHENNVPSIWQDGSRNVGVTKPIQAQDTKGDVEDGRTEENGLAYRFSVGQLPLWAKKQMFEDLSSGQKGGKTTPVQPRGRWAQRSEGQNLVVKSYLETDSVISVTNNKNDSSSLNEFQQVRESILNSYQNKSDYSPSEDSLKDMKNISGSRINMRRGSDLRSSPTKGSARHTTDESSSASSLKLEDADAEDECSDLENQLYYPPSDDGSDGGDDISYKVCATNEDELRANRRKMRRSRPEKLREVSSMSTSESVDLNSEDEDASTPVDSEPSFFGFSVSTENLERLDQREKFMKSTYESLQDKDPSSQRLFSRSSISAKYLSQNITGGPNSKSDGIVSGSDGKRTQLNSVHSTKREELTRALNEAKKKLEALGFRSGLSSSKSIGDLHSLPERDTSYIQSPARTTDSNHTGNDIRRTSSMSDISLSAKRRLFSPSPTQMTGNPGPDAVLNNSNSSGAPGLWKQATPNNSSIQESPALKKTLQQQQRQQPVVTVAPSPGRNSSTQSLPRSISMGSLKDQNNPNNPNPSVRISGGQKVPSVHTLGRVSASPRRSATASNISPMMKAQSSYTMNHLGRERLTLDIQRLHSDDSSSDTSPSETHKPLPLSKSSTFAQGRSPEHRLGIGGRHYAGVSRWADPSRSKSERDLRGVGRDTPEMRVLNRSKWHRSSGEDELYSARDPGMLPRDPKEADLTQELCLTVADELRRVTSYAMHIFQRVTLSGDLAPIEKSSMTTALAQGVLQAQQTLRPAAPPMPIWENSPKRPSLGDLSSAMAGGGGGPINPDPSTVALLQQYSDRLLNIIEQRFTKEKHSD